jgi:uncharacterized RDD family membrane protein YckC
VKEPAPEPSGYAGFVTRAVALMVDALVVDVIALLVGGAIQLIVTALGGDSELSAIEAVIGGFAWLLWSGLYFVVFWSLTGQTPGNRMLGIRVTSATGGTVGPMRAIRRFVGLLISAIPLGAGFLPVLVDDQRRGLHDRIAKTVVVWDTRARVVGVPAPIVAPVVGAVPLIEAAPSTIEGEVRPSEPPALPPTQPHTT